MLLTLPLSIPVIDTEIDNYIDAEPHDVGRAEQDTRSRGRMCHRRQPDACGAATLHGCAPRATVVMQS